MQPDLEVADLEEAVRLLHACGDCVQWMVPGAHVLVVEEDVIHELAVDNVHLEHVDAVVHCMEEHTVVVGVDTLEAVVHSWQAEVAVVHHNWNALGEVVVHMRHTAQVPIRRHSTV